jgi:hypothetical protein
MFSYLTHICTVHCCVPPSSRRDSRHQNLRKSSFQRILSQKRNKVLKRDKIGEKISPDLTSYFGESPPLPPGDNKIAVNNNYYYYYYYYYYYKNPGRIVTLLLGLQDQPVLRNRTICARTRAKVYIYG